MAYSNTTTNYNLPIYSAGDIASWTDTNQPFEDIDAAAHTAYQTAASAAQDITTLDGTVTTLSGTVAGHTSTLSTLTNTTIPALQNAVLGAATANGTSYSNTSSGLAATDVQDAIDEVYSDAKTYAGDVFAGSASGLTSGDTVTLSKSVRVKSKVLCMTTYTSIGSLRCICSPSTVQAGNDTFTLTALDTTTGTISTANDIGIVYIVVPEYEP